MPYMFRTQYQPSFLSTQSLPTVNFCMWRNKKSGKVASRVILQCSKYTQNLRKETSRLEIHLHMLRRLCKESALVLKQTRFTNL